MEVSSKKIELLMPRIEVIADYPSSPYYVGEIKDRLGDNVAAHFAKYPHLFRKVEWHEKRGIGDMPEYVKLVIKGKTQYVHKVEKWIGENSVGQPLYEYFNAVNYLSTACVSELEPATEQEYNTFINSKPTPNAKP